MGDKNRKSTRLGDVNVHCVNSDLPPSSELEGGFQPSTMLLAESLLDPRGDGAQPKYLSKYFRRKPGDVQ